MNGKQRTTGSFGDMMRTLFVLALVVGFGIALLPHRRQHSVHPIDYVADLAVFAHRAPFPVLAPQPVPAGWQVTSFRTAVKAAPGQAEVHLGLVTAAVHYAAIEETDGDAAAFLAAQAIGARSAGVITVGTADWQVLRAASDVVSLARTSGGVTVVLTGGTTKAGAATLDELRLLAGSLAPVG